jgi:hypothetical protein
MTAQQFGLGLVKPPQGSKAGAPLTLGLGGLPVIRTGVHASSLNTFAKHRLGEFRSVRSHEQASQSDKRLGSIRMRRCGCALARIECRAMQRLGFFERL